MICPLCPATLNDYTILNAHMKLEHSKTCASNFECKDDKCRRTFSSYHSFCKHFKKFKCGSDFFSTVSDDTLNVDCALNTANDTLNENVANECTLHSDPAYSFDGEKFSKNIKSHVDKFVAKLYSKSLLPRNMIQSIICDVTDLVSNCFQTEAKECVMNAIENSGVSGHLKNVTEMFHIVENAFSHVSTEHKRFKYFINCGHLVKPISCEIGVREVWKSTKDGTVRDYEKCYVELIELDIVLKKFFELPDAFDSVMSYMTHLNNESNKTCKENFMQCPLWKAKRSRFADTDIVFPINIYCDGFECNNALGPHSKSLDGVYISLPGLPKECQSVVDNIFLGLLYEASLRNDFSDTEIFHPLIEVLRKLEQDGIVVSTKSGDKRVFFITGLFLADNKAMNSLGGFVEGFSANYFCRFCRTHKSETLTQCVEDVTSLRDEISYNNDVASNDPTNTGVKSNSVFNKLPSFHITSNYSVDCFHDLAEGTCHYVLLHLLKHCIPKYFTLSLLNERIASFNYGLCDSNTLGYISEDFADKRKLKMTGSETLLFCKVLGLLIGDKVPERDPFWLLFLKLRQIIDICLSKTVSVPRSSRTLKVLVAEFNQMYTSITGDTLKPKMHNLIHYIRTLEMSGPIALQSTSRYESKHRTLTEPARGTSSRLKICATLALRHQLVQCYRFLSNESILPQLQVGSGEEIDLIDFENFYSFRNRVPKLFLNGPLFSPSWIEFKGTVFKPGMVLLVNVTDQGPRFGELKAILVKDDNFVFLFEYFLNMGFSEHIYSYAVSSSNKWSCIHPDQMADPLPLSLYNDVCGDQFIVLRYAL